jgi:hypothetical protein
MQIFARWQLMLAGIKPAKLLQLLARAFISAATAQAPQP